MLRVDRATLEAVVSCYEREGFDYLADERRFMPRKDGPARGRLPLSLHSALVAWDPARFLDRSDELRSPPLPKPPGVV